MLNLPSLLRSPLTSKTVSCQYDYYEPEILKLPPPSRGKKRTRSNFHVVMNGHAHDHDHHQHARKEVVVANKNTGFPEPFSEERNTTLPHPEADTSPNATIEAPDFDLTRTHSRSSFMHRRHHSHHRWGRHDSPEKMGYDDNITYADGDAETVASGEVEAEKTSGEKPNGVDGVVEDGERKKGVLRKLHLHKA